MSEEAADTVAVPAKKLGLVKGVGFGGILGGIALIVVGLIVWIMVATQLRAENITIPDDAIAFQGQTVQGPLTAYVQADIIQTHALHASDGKTYAELEQDDPLRSTMMDASFLRASLFTSVVSFGVAISAMGVGVMFIIFGWAITRLVADPVVVKRTPIAGGAPAE